MVRGKGLDYIMILKVITKMEVQESMCAHVSVYACVLPTCGWMAVSKCECLHIAQNVIGSTKYQITSEQQF